MKLEQELSKLDAKAKASRKGQAIASAVRLGKFKRKDFDIEVTAVEPIDGGVQVFARAWRDGVQVGFGKDGSVDIERFRFFNPPVLVSDETGDTEHSGRKLREDLEEAILQTLEHTISVKKEKFDDSKIVTGKVGRTTSTFYPDAGIGGTTVDGIVINASGTWSGTRDAASGTAVVAEFPDSWLMQVQNEGGTNYRIYRSFFTFLTSVIGTDVISSAVLSFYGKDSAPVIDNDSASINVVSSSPASDNNLVVGDFDQVGSTVFSTKSLASYSISAYNDFTLDANGIANINKTGISKFAVRGSNDVNNSAPSGTNRCLSYLADQTGTTTDPKLVVEHAAAATANTAFFAFM